MNHHKDWPCPYCKEILKTKRALSEHKKQNHINSGTKQKQCHKLAERPCQFCGRTSKFQFSLICHEKYCAMNPNKVPAPAHPVSPETRKKLSKSLHIAAIEGRNRGWTTTKSGPQHKSYPELFFTTVIDNEFNDTNYVYNMPFYTWKLDFAWPHKKLCIEIDGSQHQRDDKLHKSDIRKDAKLNECGWKVLRIRWIDAFHFTHSYIQQAKHFIDDGIIVPGEHYVKPEASKPPVRGYPIEVWEQRKNAIINSGVDLTKYGWVTKIEKKLGYTKRIIYKTVNKFKHELGNKCYRRTTGKSG